MSKPLPQLPKEVWTCIAYLLRQPFPQPRDVKERKEIRQVDLVSMMRTSKLLNNAAAPALYNLVITDDISALYHNFTSEHAVAPGILSKKELIHFTRALYLEYPTRPLSQFHKDNIHTFQHTYPQNPHDPRDSLFNSCGSYYHDPALASLIDSEMLFASDPSTQLQHAMPELEILSTGTFFGAFEDGWMGNFGGTLGFMQRVGEIQKVYTQMLLSGKIKHFCQSGNFSPLAIHPVELFDFKSPSPLSPTALQTITLHVDLQASKGVDYDGAFSSSASLHGVRVRWCFDNPRRARSTGGAKPFLGFTDQPIFAKAIFLSLVSGLGQRHEKHDAHSEPDAYPLVPFTIDAYIPMTDTTAGVLMKGVKMHNPTGSSAKEKQTNKRHKAAEQLGMALGTELFHTDVEGKVVHPDDHLRVHYIADRPPCPGCGWVASA